MTHVLALDQEHHVATDVLRMAADTFQCTQSEHGFDNMAEIVLENSDYYRTQPRNPGQLLETDPVTYCFLRDCIIGSRNQAISADTDTVAGTIIHR